MAKIKTLKNVMNIFSSMIQTTSACLSSLLMRLFFCLRLALISPSKTAAIHFEQKHGMYGHGRTVSTSN